MAVNKYFRSNFYGAEEQKLLQDLNTETIQIHGHDMYYIPRNLVAFDKLLGEDKLSAFTKAVPIEMYFETINQFEGEMEIITQFGLEIRDEITLLVSKPRFIDEVNRMDLDVRVPRSGDLVYIPIDESIFEVTFVEDKPAFYAGGSLYAYKLNCKRFEYGAESFDTGIEAVDSFQSRFAATTDITFDFHSGDFMFGERVYQGSSIVDATASGEVIKWDANTQVLSLIKVSGKFDESNVTGADSGATGIFDNVEEDVEQNVNDYNSNNDFVNDFSDVIIDRSENNPTYN